MTRDANDHLTGGKLQSFLLLLAFAYHLDDPRLVGYLVRTAIASLPSSGMPSVRRSAASNAHSCAPNTWTIHRIERSDR
jgi:hypothetical protein